MAKAKYPGFEEHIVLHKKLVEKTKKLSIDVNERQDFYQVLQLRREWWLGHINVEDRKYAPFLIK